MNQTHAALETRFQNDPLSNEPVHIIYRLYDSIPRVQLEKLKETYQAASLNLQLSYPAGEHLSLAYQNDSNRLQEKFQLSYDALLDEVQSGPLYLQDEDIKQLIIESWLKMEKMQWVIVYAISVMSNHVHVLACHPEPNASSDLTALLEKHKRFTGRKINALLDKKGERVWAEKAFDRRVRKGSFGSVFWYILNNPVKAGLVSSFDDFSGNYWHPDFG